MTKSKQTKSTNVKEVRSMANTGKDLFIPVADAFKTKQGNYVFILKGHKYMIGKATVKDWRYSRFSGEYMVKEIIPTGTKETTKSTKDVL